jgi:ATP phosphoribosyltransferase
MDPLTIALPKGRMQDAALKVFASVGLGIAPDAANGRKLVFADRSGSARYVLAKPADVPTYVEYGAADLGVVGEDALRESGRHVYEPLRLGFGHCRLMLAGPPEARERNLRLDIGLRVASKYPRLAQTYCLEQGIPAEIIPLNGSVELAPVVGLADLLVDLVETGTTLRENGLVELDLIMKSQAVLIVNRASHKLQFAVIQQLISKIAQVVADREEQR